MTPGAVSSIVTPHGTFSIIRIIETKVERKDTGTGLDELQFDLAFENPGPYLSEPLFPLQATITVAGDGTPYPGQISLLSKVVPPTFPPGLVICGLEGSPFQATFTVPKGARPVSIDADGYPVEGVQSPIGKCPSQHVAAQSLPTSVQLKFGDQPALLSLAAGSSNRTIKCALVNRSSTTRIDPWQLFFWSVDDQGYVVGGSTGSWAGQWWSGTGFGAGGTATFEYGVQAAQFVLVGAANNVVTPDQRGAPLTLASIAAIAP